jgi:hypothetical protein
VRIVVDDPGVALDERPVGTAADAPSGDSDTCGFAFYARASG